MPGRNWAATVASLSSRPSSPVARLESAQSPSSTQASRTTSGATAAQLGAVVTVVILARAITAVPAGAVIDRINPAKASLVSFTAMAIVAVFIASLLALDRLPFSILLVAVACEGVGIALALLRISPCRLR